MMSRSRTPPLDKKAYTIAEFCEVYRLSRSELYKAWANNIGPRYIRLGPRKVIILIEDAEAWAHDKTAAASASA
jgi:predicted DNA-binding transcriptional regulator AlpA